MVDTSKCVGHEFEPATIEWQQKDTILYALAVGAAKHGNQCDEGELAYTYEGVSDFRVLPTFAVRFAAFGGIMSTPGLTFNPMALLHGEQEMSFEAPLPASGRVISKGKVANVYDKGKSALVIVEARTYDAATQKLLVTARSSLFIRGIGGFGGDRGPAPENLAPPKDRAPDAVVEECTDSAQALFYRWTSGDMNPLHTDPAMAKMGGFDVPILHGLCTFGYAGRAVLAKFCGNDARRFKRIKVRFARHVFPGETLVTRMWKVSPTRVIFTTEVKERKQNALANACVDIAAASL